mmetsp:Transcript_33329/g.55111  ORF Transcript_33329/g.55111 Transcript_33329/m.55111 type:complete len:247 (-) Transcript_33329:75-815(-)
MRQIKTVMWHACTSTRMWHARNKNKIPRIELIVTPCIVCHPPGDCDALVNPANEQLDGTQFDPSTANSKLMGNAIIYPSQAIDGLVTDLGGDAMYRALQALPEHPSGGGRCPVGMAVLTPATGELVHAYNHVVHTTPPFYNSPRWRQELFSCFFATFTLAEQARFHSLAVPLLGAGARGAPSVAAADVAAHAAIDWQGSQGALHVVRFCVQEKEVAELLQAALDKAMGLDSFQHVSTSCDHFGINS